MNYRHVYMLIIEHAKSEQKLGIRKRGNGEYYEAHHILPKSLFPLWSKRKSNLVLLTLREHFFCHQLLTKVYPGPSMYAALFFMSTRKSCTSRQYAICRKALVDFNKSRPKEQAIAIAKKIHKAIKLHLENDDDFRIKYIESKKRAGRAGNTESAKNKRRLSRAEKPYTESYKRGFETLKKSEKYDSWLYKVGSSCRGKKWFNNGVNEIRSFNKPAGYNEGRLFKSKPNSQLGGKNSNATKVKDIDTGIIFETMKAFCNFYNLKAYQLKNFMEAHNIKRTKIIEISVSVLLSESLQVC